MKNKTIIAIVMRSPFLDEGIGEPKYLRDNSYAGFVGSAFYLGFVHGKGRLTKNVTQKGTKIGP